MARSIFAAPLLFRECGVRSMKALRHPGPARPDTESAFIRCHFRFHHRQLAVRFPVFATRHLVRPVLQAISQRTCPSINQLLFLGSTEHGIQSLKCPSDTFKVTCLRKCGYITTFMMTAVVNYSAYSVLLKCKKGPSRDQTMPAHKCTPPIKTKIGNLCMRRQVTRTLPSRILILPIAA